MDSSEFDEFAANYEKQHADSIRLSGEDTYYFAEYKARDACLIAERFGLLPRDILDFGSGIGNAIGPLRNNFPNAHITCLDVSKNSLAMSRKLHGEDGVQYFCYDGNQIPIDIGKFDLIFTSCVFHHIPPAEHLSLLAQLKRHLTPDGIFILFEHNPWNPLTRHAVNNCPFDENAILITAPVMLRSLKDAGFRAIKVRYRIFFPAVLAAMRPLERYLASIPFGAQYCVIAR